MRSTARDRRAPIWRSAVGKAAGAALLVSLLLPATTMAAPTGQITRAASTADGAHGSFAGSITFDGAGCTDPCHWRGILTIQPARTEPPLYPCNAYNWAYGGDPSVQAIWDSGDQTAFPGTVAFDRQDFPLLSGVPDQRLCLYIAYTSPPELENNYTCAPADPYCPPGVEQEEFQIIATAFFSVQQQQSGSGYPRPKGATPTRASLVPAYRACTTPNEAHGSPLSVPSCEPPIQLSTYLTVGTLDANGASANSVGSVRLDVKNNPSPTPSDVLINARITDVRCNGGVSTCGPANSLAGADYTGELQATTQLRITDRYNSPSGSDPATASDISFPVSVPCSSTPDMTIGGTCAISTTANAVLPGSVQTDNRAIWQLSQVQVTDGGEDGVASTTTDNTLFMKEGVFVP